ncbi:MAG: Bax inhibitor-1/YccA family protein [Bacteroidetes bacterium]|nr:Bax inhibitor-1/YccA family protein [Bacteroidota bacterium]MBP6649489.1 Bax inhibitor-1/YccA family protein [Bacteroidia bacterium]MBK6837244.1 Bax inhibitor-1/YccA family protein [Bacteroidota bacterium]MBK9523350.1 Bax inhibitor-1/YccA family protein [Bacteroidota bacterium]MBK9541093.1 Bax inhibitor-1/YccA family protein [Bacteroidota bacterium]
MENNNSNWNFNAVQQPQVGQQPIAKTFMASVFSWMGIALAISAVTSYVFGTNEGYMSYLINVEKGGLSALGYVVMFAPLGFVLLMGLGFNRLSASALTGIFLLYSVIMGVSLSFIFMAYAHGLIFQVFFISAAMFGTMAVLGYTTKTDLTKMGNILMMALIGIIIASLVNMFMRSDGLGYAISFIAVIVFTGLTAYDVQKLKNIGVTVESGSESAAKLSILGALTLYLDFINLFLALLRIFGGRRS